MRKTWMISTALAALLLAGGPALAQDSQPVQGSQPAPESVAPESVTPDPAVPDTVARDGELLPSTPSAVPAQTIIGKEAVSETGEPVGEVSDLVLSKDGQLQGLVITSGDVLGIGGKKVAVAWNDLGAARGKKAVVVAITPEEIAEAPEYVGYEGPEPSEPSANSGAAAGPQKSLVDGLKNLTGESKSKD